jgi:signal transduction histidine kinase/CheY-like chemotaxis protein
LERETPWRIANFSKDAQVNRRMVFDVAFQTNNTAWVAVSDGLYRYDGYHWRRFSTEDGLPSNFIRTVAVMRDGAVWIGTDKGAGVFDGEQFNSRDTETRLAGPNVRRIVQTSDGSLWFCCDRWPDATSAGGLTRIRKSGESHTYGAVDGLPSDHVLGLFEQSNGRIIALTSKGPCVQSGDRWTPLRDEGYPEADHTWAMVEPQDGLVFAQTFNGTMVLQDGKWRHCYSGQDRIIGPFCVTQDGTVVLATSKGSGTFCFRRWNGKEFVQSSSDFSEEAVNEMTVRSAPDGAIWAVGRGTILRWEYLPGAWEWWDALPPPVLEDTQHRIWFAGVRAAAVLQDGLARPVPGMVAPLVEDKQGIIWAGGGAGVARFAEGRVENIPAQTCGIQVLRRVVPAGSGAVWFSGDGQQGSPVLTRFEAGQWTVFGPDKLDSRKVRSLAADPVRGVWGVLGDDGSLDYDLVRVTNGSITKVEVEGAKPRTYLPSLCVAGERIYLYSYNGLWESPLGERLRFQKMDLGEGGVFTQAASAAGATAFISQEGPDGCAAIVLRRRGEWLRHPIAYGQGLWVGRDGWLMAADGPEVVLWNTEDWRSPTYLNLPTDAVIRSMLRSQGGDYWVGTSRGAMRLHPQQVLPDTVITGPKIVVEGTAQPVLAKGVAPFVPQNLARRFSFSWRIDSEPWSVYGDWPSSGVSLGGLAPGSHTIEVRARDGLGNEDPTPAKLQFVTRAIPIQDRPWFRPVLAGGGILFAALSVALFSTARRLRRYAGGLEQQVQARTAELRKDIVRREQSERVQQAIAQISEVALSANNLSELFPLMHKVIAEQMPAINFYIALLNAKGDGFQFPYYLDATEATPRAQPLKRGLAEYVLHHGKPLLASVTGIREMEAQGEVALEGFRPLSWLGVPLRTQNHALGVMVVQSYSSDVTYTQRERDVLMLMSYPIANAIERKQAEEEQRRLQDQLTQAQKIESVGRLAGGVAHDFNNMLQAILGNVSLALDEVPEGSPIRDYLEEIQTSGQRSADLTRQLLAFARRQTIQPKVLNLNDTVSGMLKMLRRLIGENIELSWQPGVDLWPIKVDPSQVDQILANLCLNARDAINGTGKLIIETANSTLDRDYLASHPDVVGGDYVMLMVSDNGHGMDAETRSHLFEPFFTTKEMGKGTGLGLATVFGIVKQNLGSISVYSEPGQGTTFKIFLPRAEVDAAVQKPVPARSTLRGTETILLVEDEEQILNLVARVLEQHGYTVIKASTPERALALEAKHSAHIDLLVSDVVMPGMNGKELFDKLRVARPDLKCLLMSGYTANLLPEHETWQRGIGYLQKPATVTSLTDKVREVLGSPVPK